MTTKDEADRHYDGTLPADPKAGAVPANAEARRIAAQEIRVYTMHDLLNEAVTRAEATERVDFCTTGHYQLDQCTGGIRAPHGWVFIAETNWGKCLGLDVLVTRADGSRCRADEVRDGDLLMGDDGAPRTVVGTVRGRGPMYRIVPKRGEPWTCNWAHVLTLVSTRTGRVVDIALDEFLSKTPTFQRQHKLYHVGIEYPTIHRPEVDPWFAGIWFGDGTKALTKVAVTTPDAEVIAGLRRTAEDWGLHVRETPRGNSLASTYSLATTHSLAATAGNPLLDALRVVYGDGERLPREYTEGSRDVRLAFLAGFIDSDGFKHGDRVCEIVTCREAWARDLRLLCRSLGLQANIYEKTSVAGYEDRVYWRVQISGDLSVVPTRVARKRFPATPGAARSGRRVGFTVEPIGDGEYAGWQLDGNGRFLLGDLTVTHNTAWLVSVTDENVKAGKPVLIVGTEDDKSIYGDRLLTRRAQLNADRVRNRELWPEEKERAHAVARKGEPLPVFVDARGKKVGAVLKECSKLVKQHGIRLIAFDYLQRFVADRTYQDERIKFREIASSLSDMAKDHGIPSIIFSQITPGEGKKYPDKYSIRESKDVANAAEFILVGMTAQSPIEAGARTIPKGTRCVKVDKGKDSRKALVAMEWNDDGAYFETVGRYGKAEALPPPTGGGWHDGLNDPMDYGPQ